MSSTLHIGMDVHKDTITIAIAEDGCPGEVRFHSTICNSLPALEKLIARLRKSHGNEVILRFAYEAGPSALSSPVGSTRSVWNVLWRPRH